MMFMAKVLNKYRDGVPQGSVYIGRPSKWGNPFFIGKDGDRDEVIAKYREWLLAQPEMVESAKCELAGKDLVCFCAPQCCHGDVLIEVANAAEAEAAKKRMRIALDVLQHYVTADGRIDATKLTNDINRGLTMENQHRHITGYRDLNENEIALMNEVKAKANEVGDLIDRLIDNADVDLRWTDLARADLQKGFMSLTRAIAKPDFF